MSKIIEMESYEDIPEYTGLEKNSASIEIKDGYEWNGHAYATCVGMIMDDGTVESYFKTDNKNGNTELFDRLRNDINLLEKHVNLINRNTMKERSGVKYFIPYKVKGHCSDKPTITDIHISYGSNVHYSVEYEILIVASDNLKRYITVEYETEGNLSICFFDEIENIENMFEEWFEEEIHSFRRDEDGNRLVTFYDETGENYVVDISSIGELMSMIMSIRVIKCDCKIIN